jgi:hypothetical protein
MTALFGGLKTAVWMQKTGKGQKVTGSQDDWWRLWAGRSGAHEWRTADPSKAMLGQLGCPRDDNKERFVARKGLLLNFATEQLIFALNCDLDRRHRNQG